MKKINNNNNQITNSSSSAQHIDSSVFMNKRECNVNITNFEIEKYWLLDMDYNDKYRKIESNKRIRKQNIEIKNMKKN